MIGFALQLVRPYWKWLLIVLGAMLVDTATALASPWPLKIVLDSVFDAKPMPSLFAWLAGENTNRLARYAQIPRRGQPAAHRVRAEHLEDMRPIFEQGTKSIFGMRPIRPCSR
jgi:hypothetical protein